VPYTAQKPGGVPSSEELRARVPGWGADLDPKDRPSVPKERFDPGATGAHWDLPEQQPERVPRERSIEHERLTPSSSRRCRRRDCPASSAAPRSGTARAAPRTG